MVKAGRKESIKIYIFLKKVKRNKDKRNKKSNTAKQIRYKPTSSQKAKVSTKKQKRKWKYSF